MTARSSSAVIRKRVAAVAVFSICQKVNQRSDSQRTHRIKGLTLCKKVKADHDAEAHNYHADLTIEVPLDVESIVAAADAFGNDIAVPNEIIRGQIEPGTAMRA